MRALAAAFILSLIASPALAIDTSLQLVINLPPDAERNLVNYQCEGIETPLSVEYINANPLFLAFVPVGDEKLLFVNVLAASGARYASGNYEWWTKGANAELTDLTLDKDTPPTTCLEVTETP